MRSDDPRTDLLAGTPFYVQHYSGIGGGCWVLTLVFFVASFFFVFSSFARLFKPTGGRWKNLHVWDARAQVVPVETRVASFFRMKARTSALGKGRSVPYSCTTNRSSYCFLTANDLCVSVEGLDDVSMWLSRLCGRNRSRLKAFPGLQERGVLIARRAQWESCKLHVVALGVELTVLVEEQSDFIGPSRARFSCWLQADFHLCLMPLRVTAHSGYINIVHYLSQASHVLRCILPFSLDVQQVSV